MRLYIILFTTFLALFSQLVFAEARIDEMCKPLSRQMKWHRGDTVYWENHVIPDYAEIVEASKPEAAKNLAFKMDLSRYRWSEDKINQANRLRIQNDCDLSQLNSSSACHHFKAFCINSIATDTLNTSFKSFNKCTSPGENPSWCGDSFKTEEGIRGNLNQLTYVANEIGKIQAGMDKNLNDYFGDVTASMEELKAQIEKAKAQSAAKIAELDKKIKEKYDRMKKEDQNFNNACSIMDKCDDYIKNEGYEDKHNLLAQTSFCSVEADNNLASEFAPLENLLKGLNGFNEKVELKNLALKSLENSTKQTVKEYASVYKALNGNSPNKTQLCSDLPALCSNAVATNYLNSTELASHVGQVPKMNIRKDIQDYNKIAKQMNTLCSQAKSNHIDENLEASINQKLFELMYQSRMGQLMSVKHFREKVPPFDQKKCFEDGEGLSPIPEDSQGDKLVKEGVFGILELQKDKASELKDQTSQIRYAAKGSPPNDDILFKELRNIIRNDPYMVQDALKVSGSPDQALWVCKATHDLYRREKRENIGKWVVTGLAIAGALVATVFTGGLAAPALIASISLAGGLAGYNLYDSITARHNAEKSIAIKSSELIFASMKLPELDSNVKAAYVEACMAALPGAIKALKYTGKGISMALNSSKLVGTSSSLANSTSKIAMAYKNGVAVTEKMLQKAIAAKLPGADPAKVKLWSEVLVGTSQDMVLEITAFAAVHPDPFSEEGMRALAASLAMSGSVNALGPVGREMVRKYNLKKNQISISKLNSSTKSNTTTDTNVGSFENALTLNTSAKTNGSSNTSTQTNNAQVKTQKSSSSQTSVNTSARQISSDNSPTQSQQSGSSKVNKSPDIDTPPTKVLHQLNGDFPNRKAWLAHLKENGGGTLKLADGTEYQLKYLGDGGTTMVFDIGDGKVLRMSKTDDPTNIEWGPQGFVNGHREISANGVPTVKIYKTDLDNGFNIVEKISIDKKVGTFDDYLIRKARGEYTPAEIAKIENDFYSFTDKTYQYQYFRDFKADQMIYTTDRGWILADVAPGNRLYVNKNENKTVFETGNKFPESATDIINTANTRIKNLREDLPTIEVKSYMADTTEAGIKTAENILGRPMSSKESNAVLSIRSSMKDGVVGADGRTLATADNLSSAQLSRIDEKLQKAGFSEAESSKLIEQGGVTYQYSKPKVDSPPVPAHLKNLDANITTLKVDGLENQIKFLQENIPGLNEAQARYLIEKSHTRNSSVVFGGSRIRGNHKPDSDLDVGFGSLTKAQASKVLKGADNIDGIPIEQTRIVPGNETQSIKMIESPEEFFMRKGMRGEHDLRAGEEYIPSGSISLYPDGTIVIVKPKN